MKQDTEQHVEGTAEDAESEAEIARNDAPSDTVEPSTADMSPDEHIAYLEGKCEDLNARWLRAQADYRNLKRRALTDHELSLQRTMQPLLEELLLVLDFLDMALMSPAESPETKNLVMGVQMTRTKFVQALDASDVTEIATKGAFDPAIHDATDTEVTEDVEPGTIVRTVRRGYTWQGRVLRPAQVVVAASATEAASSDEDGSEEARGD